MKYLYSYLDSSNNVIDVVEIDGIKYNVFTGTGTNSTIKLLIDDDIDVTPDI